MIFENTDSLLEMLKQIEMYTRTKGDDADRFVVKNPKHNNIKQMRYERSTLKLVNRHINKLLFVLPSKERFFNDVSSPKKLTFIGFFSSKVLVCCFCIFKNRNRGFASMSPRTEIFSYILQLVGTLYKYHKSRNTTELITQ